MFQYDSVEDALEALKNGEVILVTDDEDRENEGDFICSAQAAQCLSGKCRVNTWFYK